MLELFSKTTLFATVAFGALALTANTSLAKDPVSAGTGFRPYVSVFSGVSLPSKLYAHRIGGGSFNYNFDLDAGYILGADVGVHVTDQLRAELELSRASYQSNGVGLDTLDGTLNGVHGGIRATYLLANAWLDIPTNSLITPYLGGGVGIGWIGGDLHNCSNCSFGVGAEASAGFAFQVGVGVRADLSQHVSLDIGYRFKDIVGASSYNTQTNTSGYDHLNLASHNVQIGLTYNF